ncbi:hypothetical protein [Myroides odoratimimus]|uniref:Uncharacterized protein n=1 Tax=Myroides odoratimimus CIP 101113 TaxID=883154 RepID=A0AAV3F4W2_9FLAO|nr:hypothetical protein [Myroides odoratimimus]EHO13806.1 hypothetical protein HMPREF9715_00880 [Myroides odoratimimus CIP 101113]
MHKFISNTNKIHIDLTDIDITTNEENNWFSENFFVKYSYPFDVSITPELNAAIGDIMNNNSSISTVIEGLYYFYDKIEQATLIIESKEDNVVTFALKYGYDEFPNFDKKLQELPFEEFEVDDIYKYANDSIHKRYPEQLVNFPQIVTDKYPSSEVQWRFFEGRLNNRVSGFFLKNTIDNNEQYINKNIIHPCVYLIHAIQKGFESSGFTLTGDFINNNLVRKILLYADKDLFIKPTHTPIAIDISNQDQPYDTVVKNGVKYGMWKKITKVDKPGKYNIIGSLHVKGDGSNKGVLGFYRIMHNSTVVFGGKYVKNDTNLYVDEMVYINNPATEEIITIMHSEILPEYDQITKIQVIPQFIVNPDGTREPSIINSNKINIAQCLPDITFGQLVTTITNLFNLDLSVKGNVVTLNYKVKSIYDNVVHDFRKFEKVFPHINFKSDLKFLLEYEESDEDKKYDRIVIDSNGAHVIKPNEVLKPIDNTISISASPLIYDTNTVKVSSSSSADKLNLILYGGLINDNNYAEVPNPLFLPNIYEYYHREWIENRIQAKNYTPTFICQVEDILKVSVKDRLFMYNNYHLIQSISRQQISKDLFEIELSTETLKV